MCYVEWWRKITHPEAQLKIKIPKGQKRNLVVKKSKSGGRIPLIQALVDV